MALGQKVLPVLRGEPLGVPSHAMVVHFPAALLPIGFLFELVGTLSPETAGLRAAVQALFGLGLLGGLVAAATGLLDWLEMIPGTPRRARATRHLLVQAGALVLFAIAFAAQLAGRGEGSSLLVLGIAAIATVMLLVGNHLGGLLVYRDGMRVRSRS